MSVSKALSVSPPAVDWTATAFTATSTAAVSLGFIAASATTIGQLHSEWFSFVADQDVHIVFGDANVAAATTSRRRLFAGQEYQWECTPSRETHFRVIRNSADGTLYWGRSGR